MASRIPLKCGMVVWWEQADAFKDEELLTETSNCKCGGCGNPWNHMTEAERVFVKSMRAPSKEKPCGLQVLLRTEVFPTLDEMEDHMEEMLGADCWAVFTTSADRKVVHREFFNARKDRNGSQAAHQVLLLDTSPLIESVQQGQTVVIVTGMKQFYDIYYAQVGGVLLKNEVDHTLDW